MLKRILIIAAVLVTIFLAATYLWLPRQLVLTATATAGAQPPAAARVLGGGAGEEVSSPIRVEQVSSEAVLIRTPDGVRSAVALIASGGDNTLLQWKQTIPLGKGPFARWQSWQRGKGQEEEVSKWLDSAAAIASEPDRLYGMKLEEIPVTHRLLLSAVASFSETPTTESIYALAEGLRTTIRQQGLGFSDSLMVHVMEEEGGLRVRVAFPVIKAPEQGTPGFLQMVKGSLLRGSVQGGPEAVKKAKAQMQFFLNDGGRVAPAIPFEVWQTNRKEVRDTASWVTRIYFPLI